ncbi:MAG: DUF839 domain-containing protein, partial [Candidatus Kapabacteria bacterium]|nr:DUF839 domain-containing protein [Candidatus Kapabacteria bacterium]
PGGVSVLDVQFNPSTMLWQVNGIEPVDFSPVAGTVRNCSGGITPWGTVITSEETLNTGDANGDGYQDVGWQVEFDPRTRRIRDYDNDGRPDKLWSMGRISHENIAVSRDSVTIYQGEDGGTGCLYKHVSPQKGRLETGILYALRRDSATATTGTWVVVPNTTIADRNNTGTLAAAVGGTRWGGIEDAEIGLDSMIYFTEKGRGDIWRFRDNGMTVSGIEQYVRNMTYPINTTAGVINEPFQTGIDNLCFDGEGNLWAFQDGGRDHIWVIRRGHTNTNPRVELFATTVAGSEPCGLHFTPDFRYGFFSLQNASGTNTLAQTDASGRSVVMNQSVTVVFGRKEDLGVNATTPVMNLGNDITVCRGTPVSLRYSNPQVQNEWSNGSTDSVLSVTSSGRYILTGYCNNGKTIRDTINVTFTDLPTISIGPDRTVCSGETVRLSYTGANAQRFTWDDGSTNFFRDVVESGVYHLTVVNQSGCANRDTAFIRFIPAPVAKISGEQELCKGTAVVLNAGAGFSRYQWNTGAATPTITVLEPGMYSVAVSHSLNVCEGRDTVVITRAQSAFLGSDITLCQGSDIVLNPGNSFSSYMWSDGSLGKTLRVGQAGQYWVRVLDKHNCQSYDTVSIAVLKVPAIELGRDTILCNECSITLDAGAGFREYRWSSGETTRTITVRKPGIYRVTATTNEGCSAADAIDIWGASITSVGNETGLSDAGMNVMPNPFKDKLIVACTLPAASTVTMRLYTNAGILCSELMTNETIDQQQTVTLQTPATLSTGVYILQAIINDKVYYKTIVKH